ncbi:hypothetical protein LTR05_000594 [Lithohypha guttulata]|uniref:Uncharacterized protein n=1 Tax=Lithohypha guttulata TaxID=1690604 RepID=A0AAN7YE24_9EURO|nr:hypothetical protein LTR05_000594 [Lithohypha guttulata]
MKSFFDPVVESVIKKVEEQKAQLARKNAKINRVVLIGGFGDSPYLNARLKSWCTSNDIRRFTCPTDCQAAIVKGAVLRGLEGIRPTTIVAKRSYGWSWGCAFREGIDDEEDAYHDIYTGHKLCTRMHWTVTKGQEIDSDFKVARTVKTSVKDGEEWRSKLTLYSCPLDVPPERPDHVSIVREGVVITQFTSLSNVDRSKYSDEFSMTVYRFKYDLETNFRAEDGILAFNSSRNGKEVGNTTINFESR